jgi:hypothetical protein
MACNEAKVMPTIEVTPEIVIDQSELAFSFARAGGPGGQNVNKVETAVQLRLDVTHSSSSGAASIAGPHRPRQRERTLSPGGWRGDRARERRISILRSHR